MLIWEFVEVAELLEFEEEEEEELLEDELVLEAVLPPELALAVALELAEAVLVADPEPVVEVTADELEELVVLAVAVAGLPFDAPVLDAFPEAVELAFAVAVAEP